MKLLIFTQKVDRNDQTLGFFHSWIKELSYKAESVSVICLYKGDFDLPKNVKVFSLGKERGISKIGYIINLYKYLLNLSGSYDKVFVHMNEEYILLLGLYWKIKRIPVYLWRNHPRGSFLTKIAVFLSNKVFYTSKGSFTSASSKSYSMPVGIDTDIFKPILGVIRKKYSICMVGRVSKIKNIDLALEAINRLVVQAVQTSIVIIGPVSDSDSDYFTLLKNYVADKKLQKVVTFMPGVSPDKLPEIYSSFELCLNLTEEGSFDKTIVEATACGAVPIVLGSSFNDLLPEICITKNSAEEVAISIEKLIRADEQIKINRELEDFVKKQSLQALMQKLTAELK